MSRLGLALALVTVWAAACAQHTTPSLGTTVPNPGAAKTLTLMTSESELRRAMEEVAEAKRHADEARRVAEQEAEERWREWCRKLQQEKERYDENGIYIVVCGRSPVIGGMTVSRRPIMVPTISNQHPELEQGTIVKRHGDVLLVLQRGRLFSFAIGGGRLDSVTVASTSEDGGFDDWYDEMFVWERTVILVGSGGAGNRSSVVLFDLDAAGRLRYRETHQIRADDYDASASRYSARLIGDRLLLFTSMFLVDHDDPSDWLPAMGRIQDAGTPAPMTVMPETRVFRPVNPLGPYTRAFASISCRVAPTFSCHATVILGEVLRAYYVSPSAAYAWTAPTDWFDDDRSVVYRFPLDASPVTAIGVHGMPGNQLDFLEDERHHLNVSIRNADGISLLRIPIASFADGKTDAAANDYRSVAEGTQLYSVSHFVGRYLVASISQERVEPDKVVLVMDRERGRLHSLTLPHVVEGIEPVGADAVVIGPGDGGTGVTAISLGATPRAGNTLILPHAPGDEVYTHASLYHPRRANSGMVGLPVRVFGRSGVDDTHVEQLVLVDKQGLALARAGEINVAQRYDDSYSEPTPHPFFIGDRLFAVLGTELVEGRVSGRQIGPLRRIDLKR